MGKQNRTMRPGGLGTAEATINVRLPKVLKNGGEQVLEREGISVSDTVRRLYLHLERTQEIPQYLMGDGEKTALQEVDEKRKMLKQLVGISRSKLSMEQIKDERLRRQLRSGVS